MESEADLTAVTPKHDLAVIVPTYKEVDNIPVLIGEIAKVMAQTKLSYEIIIVDDDSRDGTSECVSGLADRYPVRLVTRTNERGLSSAVIRGFDEADAEILLCMDADLSHPPSAIPQMVRKLRAGADFVLGSRYVPGGQTEGDWGLFRWLNSKVATLLALPFTRAADPMSGFFALCRTAFLEAKNTLSPIGYKIGLELIVKCGYVQVVEVPITFANRQRGQSKLSLTEQLNYIKHLKRLADFKYKALSHFFQFSVIGASGAVVDLASYTLLMSYIPLTVARGMAIVVAMLWNFLLNRQINYSEHARDGKVFTQLGRFVIACAAGAGINWAVSIQSMRFIDALSDHALIAAVFGIVAGTATNFLLTHTWVFRHHKQ